VGIYGEAASFALGEAASFALGEAASFAYKNILCLYRSRIKTRQTGQVRDDIWSTG
jgi:hypothetical protein